MVINSMKDKLRKIGKKRNKKDLKRKEEKTVKRKK